MTRPTVLSGNPQKEAFKSSNFGTTLCLIYYWVHFSVCLVHFLGLYAKSNTKRQNLKSEVSTQDILNKKGQHLVTMETHHRRSILDLVSENPKEDNPRRSARNYKSMFRPGPSLLLKTRILTKGVKLKLSLSVESFKSFFVCFGFFSQLELSVLPRNLNSQLIVTLSRSLS